MNKKDKGNVLGGSYVNPNLPTSLRRATGTGQGQDEAPEQLSEAMRGLQMAAGFEVNITNTEVNRTDSIEIPTRNWTVAVLKDAYRESMLKKKLWKLNERWFDYTDIDLSFNGEDMDEKYTLSRYRIRPGSTLVATCTPKVKITIKNQAGQKKPYTFEGSVDWTIQKMKEEYCKMRLMRGAHNWKAEDIVLMANDGIGIDDSGNLSDFAPRVRDKRGDVFFKCNYRWNGMSYTSSSDGSVNSYGEGGNRAFGTMTQEEEDSAWNNVEQSW